MRVVIVTVLISTMFFAASGVNSAPDMPVPLGPPAGTVLSDFTTTITWKNPPGTTQVHLEVVPANNDGPGVDVILNPVESFRLPPPPEWYGLLPDMSYSWRVQASNATTSVPLNDPSWGKWTTIWTFRTPKVRNGVIPISPGDGSVLGALPKTIQWGDVIPGIYYYEFQLSSDKNFDTNPETAIAPISYLLIHGGVTSPANSYQLTETLKDGVTYYWRVRPRVQGDGVPVMWSQSWSFMQRAGGSELIQNGDFESSGGWTDDCLCITAGLTSWHSGRAGAYLSPRQGKDTANITQQITVPAGVKNAVLTYWFQLTGYDSRDNDCFSVGILQQGVTRPQALKAHCVASGYINGWTQETLDMSSFSGQTITLMFQMGTQYFYTHNNLALLDDVSLQIQ